MLAMFQGKRRDEFVSWELGPLACDSSVTACTGAGGGTVLIFLTLAFSFYSKTPTADTAR